MKLVGETKTHMRWLSIERDISGTEVPQRSEGPQAHTRAPQDRFPVPGRGVFTKLGFQPLSETEGSWKPKDHLKRLTHRLIHSPGIALGSSGGTAAWEVTETYRGRLSCVVLG